MKKKNRAREVALAGSKSSLASGGDSVGELMTRLGSRDGAERLQSRHELVKIGKAAVPYLVEGLAGGDDRTRWEAAKALNEIEDPMATRALVEALNDGVPGVRWLAGEALIKLNGASLVPLLKGLENHFDSAWFRQGAHHVLRTLAAEDSLPHHVTQVLEALSNREPGEAVALAAKRALTSLRGK